MSKQSVVGTFRRRLLFHFGWRVVKESLLIGVNFDLSSEEHLGKELRERVSGL